ncbi:MAG: DUF393 domain-containing protein [Opitutaceae bacterium]
MPSRSVNREPHAIVLFDGDCAFCRRLVAFAQQRDRLRRLEFWPLQSEEARALLARRGQSPDDLTAMRIVEGQNVSRGSDAVLRLGRRLVPPWAWLAAALTLFPRRLRDCVYRFVAKRRKFGAT